MPKTITAVILFAAPIIIMGMPPTKRQTERTAKTRSLVADLFICFIFSLLSEILSDIFYKHRADFLIGR